MTAGNIKLVDEMIDPNDVTARNIARLYAAANHSYNPLTDPGCTC